MTHPSAGTRPHLRDLLSRQEVERRYRSPQGPLLPVRNGTSGHRGAVGPAFSEAHVAAMVQALCDLRRERGAFGPRTPPPDCPAGWVVVGKDVRYASDLAEVTAVEVLAGNGIPVVVHQGGRATPTPVVSHRILAENARGGGWEGVILTASHNPPEDAGCKTNGLDGGANTRTGPIDAAANALLDDPSRIRRTHRAEARRIGLVREEDLVLPYVRDLASVVDFEPIRGVPFAATPLGGSAHGYYEAVNEAHHTAIHVVLPEPDPASSLRTRDWDGRLRGDPSSPWVMQAVSGLRERVGAPLLGANDNDADRFGLEDASGVVSPNHALCVLFDYLCRHRRFRSDLGVGRTIGTTHLLDRIAETHGRPVTEVPVGFKWYVEGLEAGRYVLAGEESAGLCVPRRDGSVWVTEKDGIAAVLLFMEVVGRTGRDVGSLYRDLEARYGPHRYERVDTPATSRIRARLQALSLDPAQVASLLSGRRVAGRAVERVRTGDGVKVVLEGGIWVLKRASGTEDVVKDYREEPGESLDTARRASAELDAILGLESG
ncbi:MAG: phosphoglucomutase [Deltaproteobacteria bacterium]|nr:phosphoglucomutase [Deltaproteobacteria bacterium]